MQINIKEKTIIELKAMVYDEIGKMEAANAELGKMDAAKIEIRKIELAKNNITALNREIAEKMGQEKPITQE